MEFQYQKGPKKTARNDFLNRLKKEIHQDEYNGKGLSKTRKKVIQYLLDDHLELKLNQILDEGVFQLSSIDFGDKVEIEEGEVDVQIDFVHDYLDKYKLWLKLRCEDQLLEQFGYEKTIRGG